MNIFKSNSRAHGRVARCSESSCRLLGSDANFAAMRSNAPFGRAEGTANLDSDPKNLLRSVRLALHPEN